MNEDVKHNFIITLTGPSGCGTSYIKKCIMEIQNELLDEDLVFKPVIFPKYVTRPLREVEIERVLHGEQIDIISVVDIPDKCDIRYQTYGKQYAFCSEDLKAHLENGECPIVVINDVRAVGETKKLFPNKVFSLFLFRKVPKIELFEKEAAERGGGAEQEIEARYNRANSTFRTCIENIGLFNRVVLNVGDDTTPDYAKIQIKNLIKCVLLGKLGLES